MEFFPSCMPRTSGSTPGDITHLVLWGWGRDSWKLELESKVMCPSKDTPDSCFLLTCQLQLASLQWACFLFLT